MTLNERCIIATVAGVIWDEYPICAGHFEHYVFGVRFKNPPGVERAKLSERIEVHELIGGPFRDYRTARDCERAAYHHEFTWIEKYKLCLLTDRDRMTYYDRQAFIEQTIRENMERNDNVQASIHSTETMAKSD
jgi:hypothetical protein